MTPRFPLLLFLGAALSCASGAAQTWVAGQIQSANRLIPLNKITVGPDDQYHGLVDPSGTSLVFTKKSDLVPHLCTQNLATGEVRDLLPLSADSQEAAVSPDGLVAFTYYKFSARGDICYRPLRGSVEQKIRCLPGSEDERSAPFWRSARELGYLLRNMKTLLSQVVVENIDTGKKEVLAEGRIWSPSMTHGGRYLLYNALNLALPGEEGPARVLVLKDLQAGTTKTLHFQLPGFSGFPAVSEDENFLFFSHYLSDTNNDNVIDGNDNGIVFRAPIGSLQKETEIFPEQLTSAESNCSFPRPHGDRLFVTCAMEGSLDIYEVPATGIVPSQWNESMLANAHQSSRSYEERILILNTLKFRFKSSDTTALQERLLSDYLLADDASAATYYLQRLQAKAGAAGDKKDFYQLLRLYLTAREEKKKQPSEEIDRAFRERILAIDQSMEKIAGQPRLKPVLRGGLRTFLNEPQQALGFLKQAHFNSQARALERLYYFELASWTLARVKPPEDLTPIYVEMMKAPELSPESRIYYAFHFLEYLMASKDRAARISKIESANHGLPDTVAALLGSEVAALRIIGSPDEKSKRLAYPALDKFLVSSQTDYFLRKALYVRAILNFEEAAEFRYLNFVANAWLRFTKREDTEFSSARNVFVNATLERAYDNYAKKEIQLAGDYFFGSLTLTDDLESHSGYIRSMLQRKQRENLDKVYLDLQKRQMVDGNMKFVEALLRLIDAEASAGNSRETGHLDFAIAKLKSMEQDRDSPVRYLLLGYCYLDKLERLANGYDFDRDLLEEAHRTLMLAYDGGRDNVRIKAAALMDLGLLHQRVQNHGLAVKFFAKRKELGFISPDEATRFSWVYAKSLYYLEQADKAAEEIMAALKSGTQPTAFLERKAFYLQAAGDFKSAAQAYRDFFKKSSGTADLNLAKAYLGYGYTSFKLKDFKIARQALSQSLEYAGRLQPIRKGAGRSIDFEPVRLKLDAYGLLGRFGSDAQRLEALEKRAQLLPQAMALFNDGRVLTLRNELQIAQLANKNDPSKAASHLREAVKLTQTLGESDGYLSHAVFQSTVDCLVHGALHPQLYGQEDSGSLQKLVDKSLEAYAAQKQAQPVLEYQKLKLRILWAAYSKSGREEIQAILKKMPPDTANADELRKLAAAFGNLKT